MEIDHGFCRRSTRTTPTAILVEFCTDTKPYTADDRGACVPAMLEATAPELESPPSPRFHKAPQKATAPA